MQNLAYPLVLPNAAGTTIVSWPTGYGELTIATPDLAGTTLEKDVSGSWVTLSGPLPAGGLLRVIKPAGPLTLNGYVANYLIDTVGVQDTVGGMIVAAGGTYNGTTHAITLPSSGGAGGLVNLTYRQGWNVGTAYAANDAVTYDGGLWSVSSTVTGGPTPGTGGSSWTVVVSKGAAGATGPAGAAGQGVPTGGTIGQVLSKTSSTNFDTQWVTPSSGGGTALNPNPTFSTLGDSITYGTGAGPGSWGDTLASARSWTYLENGGIVSSTLSSGSGSTSPMVSRYADYLTPTAPGHYFLFGGVNDWSQNLPLGEVGDTAATTIAGAALSIARGVLSTASMSNSVFYIVLPTWKGSEDSGPRNSTGYTLEQVRQVLRAVGTIAAREYPGRVRVAETKDLTDYYRTSSGTGSSLMSDGVHPDGAGKTLLGKHIAAYTLGANGSYVPPVTLFSDDFNRADGAPGGNYVSTEGSHVISSNALTVTGGAASFSRIAASGAVYANDGKTYILSATIRRHGALTFLGSNDGQDLYFIQWQDDEVLTIYHHVASSFTQIGGVYASSAIASAEIRVESTGSSHAIFFNGSLLTTLTIAPAANLNYGLFNYFNAGRVNSIDNLLLTRSP